MNDEERKRVGAHLTWATFTNFRLIREEPFASKTKSQTRAAIKNGEFSVTGEEWEHISENAKDFIHWLMRKERHERMTVEEALGHPWIGVPRFTPRYRAYAMHWHRSAKQIVDNGIWGASLLINNLTKRAEVAEAR